LASFRSSLSRRQPAILCCRRAKTILHVSGWRGWSRSAGSAAMLCKCDFDDGFQSRTISGSELDGRRFGFACAIDGRRSTDAPGLRGRRLGGGFVSAAWPWNGPALRCICALGDSRPRSPGSRGVFRRREAFRSTPDYFPWRLIPCPNTPTRSLWKLGHALLGIGDESNPLLRASSIQAVRVSRPVDGHVNLSPTVAAPAAAVSTSHQHSARFGFLGPLKLHEELICIFRRLDTFTRSSVSLVSCSHCICSLGAGGLTQIAPLEWLASLR